jgi:hypothetical protein
VAGTEVALPPRIEVAALFALVPALLPALEVEAPGLAAAVAGAALGLPAADEVTALGLAAVVAGAALGLAALDEVAALGLAAVVAGAALGLAAAVVGAVLWLAVVDEVAALGVAAAVVGALLWLAVVVAGAALGELALLAAARRGPAAVVGFGDPPDGRGTSVARVPRSRDPWASAVCRGTALALARARVASRVCAGKLVSAPGGDADLALVSHHPGASTTARVIAAPRYASTNLFTVLQCTSPE